MSRKFTILPHILQQLTQFKFIEHMIANANFWVKNVKLILNWHAGKITSSNIAPSKTQNLSRWVLGEVLHLYYSQEFFSGLPQQEAKSSKSLSLKFTYVTTTCLN